MTKQQIRELVRKTIEGQGTQVDAGSTLPTIFYGIIDGMSETSEVDDFEDFHAATAYAQGDIVRYEGKLYVFTEDKDAGPWDATKAEATTVFNLLYDMMPLTVTTTISALEAADLTAEQAAAAGFTTLAVNSLFMATNPTIHFSDMSVTFNTVDVISHELVNLSTVIVHTTTGGGELLKAILSVNINGSVSYHVTNLTSTAKE